MGFGGHLVWEGIQGLLYHRPRTHRLLPFRHLRHLLPFRRIGDEAMFEQVLEGR